MYEIEKITIKWNGRDEEIEVREILAKEYNDILRKVMQIETIGSTVKTKLDVVKQKELTVLKGIYKAPFTINEENTGKLKISDFEKIHDKVQELSNLTKQEKKTSDQLQEEEE